MQYFVNLQDKIAASLHLTCKERQNAPILAFSGMPLIANVKQIQTEEPDAELIARYAAGRDEGAFSDLVRRYGPQVLAVARRMLWNEHDALDAFQATFLALSQAIAKGKLRNIAAVGAWLHEATVRSCRSLRRENMTWKKRIESKKGLAEEVPDTTCQTDLGELVAWELARLPPHFRTALLLCDMEGLTSKEAAMRLGTSASTIRNHITQGRQLLKKRLLRQGMSLPAGMLATLFVSTKSVSAETELLFATTVKNSLVFAATGTAKTLELSPIVAATAKKVLFSMTFSKHLLLTASAVGILLFSGAVLQFMGVAMSSARASQFNFHSAQPLSFNALGTAHFSSSIHST